MTANISTSMSATVQNLVETMTLEQKVAQLVSYWVDQGAENVAPMSGDMAPDASYDLVTQNGLGHLTRVYGTRPVDPKNRAEWLIEAQKKIRENSGHDIAAIVHEECLTGLAAWQATTYPSPLAWGCAFNPALVRKMGKQIGTDMVALGIHQGLAPVLDVIRDARWGRVEEAISEDPYVVGTIGTAYVEGLQEGGVDATLKHFLGYSASVAGRNHAPVRSGRREVAEVYLPPFQMALREGNARSVMNSYAEIDGVPVGGDPEILTTLLRDQLGFEGVVVADYFAVAFLHLMQRTAPDKLEAAKQALTAGIDVELPGADAYPLLTQAIEDGQFPLDYVDRALIRVLEQKERHGLIGGTGITPHVQETLDTAENRAVALELAEQSLVLLSNDGTLPLNTKSTNIALVGPNADSSEALMGCYSFVNHVLAHHRGLPDGIELPTVLGALETELPGAALTYAPGCSIEGVGPEEDASIEAAVQATRNADTIVAVVGDRAGLFGRGTVGEGNDVDDLDLPGRQRELVEALCQTGKPVVLVLLTGRPYILDWAFATEGGPAAVIQGFFPGEEGAVAVARVLSGAVNPSGHLTVSLPRSSGSQPFTYLHPPLAGHSEITALDPTPVKPFGFGLSYTTFARTDLAVTGAPSTSTGFTATVTVTNAGERAGSDLVQLYGRDLYASVTRPVAQLLAYQRVALEPGESATITFTVPPWRVSLVDRNLERIVEPGQWELWVGPSCDVAETRADLCLSGDIYAIGHSDSMRATVEVERK